MCENCFSAEVGNFSDDLVDQNYLSTLKLLPNQTRDIELKIMEHHKEHWFVDLTNLNCLSANVLPLDSKLMYRLYVSENFLCTHFNR